VLKEHRW